MRIAFLLRGLPLLALLAGGCKNAQTTTMDTNSSGSAPAQLDFNAGPPTIVYKTKNDYTDKVAIILQKDKTSIASYPHPRDIAKRGNEVKPTVLANGYLLDNQGINAQVAFTRYTFAQYAALPKAPTLAELQVSIIDKDPLEQICHCGNRNQFKQVEDNLNQLIAQNLIPCKALPLPGKTE